MPMRAGCNSLFVIAITDEEHRCKRPNIWQIVRGSHARRGHVHKPGDALEAAIKPKVQIIRVRGWKLAWTPAGALASQHGNSENQLS